LIGDSVINNVAAKDRDIAMVFQSYALYPHMSVFDNMASRCMMQHMKKSEIDKRVRNASRILGLDNFLSRKPRALSGGQRPRVALCRATVRSPTVILLDEPRSNLDAKLRGRTRVELEKLHRDLQTTFIYVMHHVTARVDPRIKVAPGEKIRLGLDSRGMHLFDTETEQALL